MVAVYASASGYNDDGFTVGKAALRNTALRAVNCISHGTYTIPYIGHCHHRTAMRLAGASLYLKGLTDELRRRHHIHGVQSESVLNVTTDFPPVNVQGQEMLADLNGLAMRLDREREVKVLIFQSAHPEIWACHDDTNLLKDMSTTALSRDEAETYGTVNKALDPDQIGPYIDNLAKRIAKSPAASINACQQAVYESIDKPINEAVKAEAYGSVADRAALAMSLCNWPGTLARRSFPPAAVSSS